ncbi:hypothetical protein D9619_001320 [Psilocybe cf. subviscida]|uniref:F-box domain-containing protein n=1 Tax=Psilocybe cf. subviscida TaxID=2480587 RepID=A0A8H5BFA4_9AGAR|nr:hypothetical protein D9619_001320 [Psilocybe cf. subviscida]
MMSPNFPWLNKVLPSEVLNALSNNDPPKQDVIRTVKAFRDSPASLSSVVDKRIGDIDKQISALLQEKSQLRNSNNVRLAIEETYTTICAPFRLIPLDILREIARHSLDAHPFARRNRALMNLTHVSSKWRSVVTRSPNFWTTLHLHINKADFDSLVKHLEVVQTWFCRAGSLPIRLYLYVGCKLLPEDSTAHHFRMFLKALAPWSSRICHLGIGGRNWVNLITKFADIKWDLSTLVRLDLISYTDGGSNAWAPAMNELASVSDKITLFRAAKRLTTLGASLELSPYIRSFGFLPWKRIQHLTLEEFDSKTYDQFALLKQCPQLQTAYLRWSNDSVLMPEKEPYSLEKLEKLHLDDISVVHFNQLARFFSQASFPGLTHLHICIQALLYGSEGPTAQLDPIPLFPSLQFFSVMDDDGIPLHLTLKFLSKMPRLQTFNMEISSFGDRDHHTDLNKLCKYLTISAGRCDYLPLLEECSFFWESAGRPYVLDVTVIARFIQARTQDVPPTSAF